MKCLTQLCFDSDELEVHSFCAFWFVQDTSLFHAVSTHHRWLCLFSHSRTKKFFIKKGFTFSSFHRLCIDYVLFMSLPIMSSHTVRLQLACASSSSKTLKASMCVCAESCKMRILFRSLTASSQKGYSDEICSFYVLLLISNFLCCILSNISRFLEV